MGVLFIFSFLLIVFSGPAFAQTCEETRAQQLSAYTQDCGPSACEYYPYETLCRSFKPLIVKAIQHSNGIDTGLHLTCAYTETLDKFYPDSPPMHFSTDVESFLGIAYDCQKRQVYPQSAGRGVGTGSGAGAGGPPGGCSVAGSIVYVEDGVLTEEVALVGGQSLIYHSGFQSGKVSDFKLELVLSGNTVRDYITSFSIENRRNGVLVDSASFSNTSPNQSYIYNWDGLDSLSVNKALSAAFEIKFTEVSPSGSFAATLQKTLSHLDAHSFGLGGWLPKSLRIYDPGAKYLFVPMGGATAVEAKTYGVGQLYIADADGKEVYIFDATGRHLYTKTGLTGTNTYAFNYDSLGRLTSIDEPFGKTTYFNRNFSGQLVSITSPNGQSTLVSLDTNGYISSLINPNSETYSMTYYGAGGLMHTFQKPNGEVSTFEYDSNGLVVKDTHSGGYFFELVRNLNPSYTFDVNIVTSEGRSSQVLATRSDAGHFSRTSTSSSGVVGSVSYSESGGYSRNDTLYGVNRSVSSVDDQRFGEMVKFPQVISSSFNGGGYRSLDVAQNVTLSDPADPFSITSWQETRQLSGENTKLTTVFDPLAKKFTATTFLGKVSEWTIDNYERTISTKQGNLEQVNLGYTNEHLTSVTQGTRVTSLAYNSLGLLETITNPLSEATSYVYDSANRVASKVLPDSRVVGFSYDGVGNLTGVTPPGRPLHSFSLNGHGLVGAYVPPALTGVSVVNTTYFYNLDKQMTAVVRPDGGFINYNYNATTGVLENYETPEGFYTQYMDTVVGLPNHMETPAGVSTQIGYMARSPVSFTNSVAGNSAGSYAPTFGTSNRMESDTVTGPTGTTSAISYLYNDDEDLKKAGDVNISYNVPNGQLTGTSMGSGSTGFTDAYTYNTFGEVTGYQAKRGTAVIYDLTLSRDGMGRINGKTQIMNSVTDDYDYTFDSTGRLTQVQKNSVVSVNYSYDSNSNRTGGSVGSQPTTATYDDQDRLLTYNTYSFTYNANGDLQSKTNSVTSATTQYSYDVFGNLRQVTLPTGTVIDYEVDALNRRIGKRVNGVLQKRWIYMDQYRIAAEANGAGAITKRFVYGSKTNIPDYMIASGVKYRIISDHLGSPRLVVKQSDGTVIQRMDHDEFGRVITDTNPGYLPFGFAGGLYDHQTSLVRFGARDYDPEVGRWTSKDPIRFEGEDTNLFGYVLNDPVNWVDTEGLKPSSGAVTANPTWPAGGGIAVGVAIEVCSPKPAKKKENCQKVFDDTLSSCLAKGDKPAKCVSEAGTAYRACVERANAN